MLVGRRSETEALDRLLVGALEGRSGVLVLRGEAGIGKTSLLAYAQKQASMTVLRAVGIESESELAFAGLHQLFRPVLDRLERLPEPQAAALRTAFALSGDELGDRFRVSVGVLGLLSEVAEEQPLLCVVDDAQWLDEPSADALLFAARRLAAEPVAILFAARTDLLTPFSAEGLPELELPPLDAADARALAIERVADADTATIDWLVDHGQGNPLALVELAASRPGTGEPATTTVEQSYRERIERLPPTAQKLLVLAAAEESGDRAAIARAASTLGLELTALAHAEAAGLVNVGTELLEFRHPLVRSAAYRGANFAERERAHAALAAALDRPEEADRRAWHRAAATVGSDESVAAELEASAARAQQRGGPAAAAAALARAAVMSEDDAERGRRLVLAGDAAANGGKYELALDSLERAAQLDLDPLLRADLASARGAVDLLRTAPAESCDMLITAAEEVAPHDVRRALHLVQAAAQAGAIACDTERMTRAASIVPSLALSDESADLALMTVLPVAGTQLFRGELAEAAAGLRRAIEFGPPGDSPRDLAYRGIAATLAGEAALAQALYRRAAARARELGTPGPLLAVLNGTALANMFFAEVEAAWSNAHEALRLAADLGLGQDSHARGVLAWVVGVRGDAPEHERVAELVRERTAPGMAIPPAAVAWGRANLALAVGSWDAALADLTALAHPRPGFGHPLLAAASAADLVEAAVRKGEPELGDPGLRRLESWVDHTSPQHLQPLLERARALRAESPERAEHHYRNALELHDGDDSAFNRAHTELLLGEHLRRERRRADARVHLRSALANFERLGAARWADRASAELRATGERARRRDPSTLGELTPQEQQIARLVGEGASNKDVAAQLFLSPRTVEYHLRKVFQKLDIASRAELIRAGVGTEDAVRA